MQPLRYVGREQGKLTLEEYEHVEAEIVTAVYPILIGRRVYPTTPLSDAGWMYTKFYSEVDMSQAQISMFGETESEDQIVHDQERLPIPIIHKDFLLHWRDVLAGRHRGESLDAAHARNAGRQVAEEEDKLLLSGEYVGWPALGIQGLSTITGRSTCASTGAWPANALTDINCCRSALQSSGFVGVDFVMIGPVALIKRLDAQIGTTNITYRKFLLDNDLLAAIYESDNVFAADGGQDSILIVVPGKDNFDLVEAASLSTFMWQDKHMNQHGKVYEAVVPRIRRPTSVCEMTGVT